MENENLEQEESILTLTDENGQDMDFEYLGCLPYEGKESVSYTHLRAHET